MKRIALLFPLALVVVALTALAAFAGRASATTTDPVPGWLAPSCPALGSDGESPNVRITILNWWDPSCNTVTTPVVTCVDGKTLTIWTNDEAPVDPNDSNLGDMIDSINEHAGHHAAFGACASSWTAPAAREAYCSVAGDTNPFTGTPIAPGTFLNLLAGQAATDMHYTGAVPAWWVQGVGLTCSLTPSQAALAAASTQRVGAAGDPETPIAGIPDYAIYTYVPAK